MMRSQSLRSALLLTFCLASFGVFAATPSYVVDSSGIYNVGAAGKRERVYQPSKDEDLMASTFTLSPNKNWALVNVVPANPGKGRVEEIRILVSLTTGARLDQERFQSRYGAWLDESAEWSSEKPATIILGSGKHVQVR